jgi:hypothetical protein
MYKQRLKDAAMLCVFAFFFGMASVPFASKTYAATNSENNSSQSVKEKASDVSTKIEKYTIKQRDEAVRKAKESLADLDERIDRMENRLAKKWAQMDESAREKARATMKSLRKQRTEAAEWYGSLKHSSSAAWQDVKKGFSKSYKDLKDAFIKAEREY